MYDDIIHLAMDQQLLTEIRERDNNYKRLPLWKELQKNIDTTLIENELKMNNELTFDNIFHEPVGFFLIKEFLKTEHSVVKAIFVRDVETYKELNDPRARQKVGYKIYKRFLLNNNNNINNNDNNNENECKSVFEFDSKNDDIMDDDININMNSNDDMNIINDETDININNSDEINRENTVTVSNFNDTDELKINDKNNKKDWRLSLITENTNTIGVYGRLIKKLEDDINNNNYNKNIFDSIYQEVLSDLRLDVFPRFKSQINNKLNDDLGMKFNDNTTTDTSNNNAGSNNKKSKSRFGKKREKLLSTNSNTVSMDQTNSQTNNSTLNQAQTSSFYQMYLRCKSIERQEITVKDFHQMRMLGRGAFGSVNACKKKDTGKLYAMKQLNKKRVQATDSAETIMSERNFLSEMDSKFVTTLKYAFMDENTLFLILDLMIGGDLKYHLNSEKTFNEARSKFYAAEVLLGLHHIHSKNIIYRDLKLENVLVDDRGHVKISDLGLAVKMTKGNVKGYAGTPGYTAPEVVLNHYYNHIVDFFSLGVMIFRFLCGKKPFQSRKRHRNGPKTNREVEQRRRTTELDRNVVEMEPEFPSTFFSGESRSLLKGLLCKNRENRLGRNGINEIKQHPWFDSIDFGLLEAGYLHPPYEPSLDEIHAEQQQHIGRPPKDEIYDRTRIKPEFERSLIKFNYANKKVIQQEIVEVLEKVQEQRRKNNGNDVDNIISFIPESERHIKSNRCLGKCVIL